VPDFGTKTAYNAVKVMRETHFTAVDVLGTKPVEETNMAPKAFDTIKPWFDAMEEMGEYIGIRFGRIPPGKSVPEWSFLKHTQVDGIGGLAVMLRQQGVSLPHLPQNKYPSNPSWSWFLKTVPKYLKPRRRLKWRPVEQGPAVDASKEPPPAVAWHVFGETPSTRIRRACRKAGVTVNSFLLKHLNKAIRPYLEDESAVIPWMIPVNLRGKVVREQDTSNFSSYVGVNIRPYETVVDVHRAIYAALASGEHWGNWYAYRVTRLSSRGIKKHLLATDRAMSQWFLGGFSNLGDWDSEKTITQKQCLGHWLFSPPVLRCQRVGAGCITFQNCLSLTIQAHPDLTTNPAVAGAWMHSWVKEIEIDLSSLLSDSPALP
jgi:hypothetical protein